MGSVVRRIPDLSELAAGLSPRVRNSPASRSVRPSEGSGRLRLPGHGSVVDRDETVCVDIQALRCDPLHCGGGEAWSEKNQTAT